MMKRKTVKIIACAIAGVLVICLLLSILSSMFYVRTYAGSKIDTLKGQLSSLESEKKEVKKEIESLNSSISSASDKKAALDKKISVTQHEIDTTQEIIDELSSQIEVKGNELVAAEKQLDEQTKLFEKRIRVMYENGEVTYLDTLLSSHDFSEMLSRVEIVGQIMDYDNNLVNEYTVLKDDVAEKKANLESDKVDQEEYKDTLKDKKAQIAVELAESKKIIESLNDDLDAKKAEAQKMEDEKDSIAAEIKRLAEEQRRLEEAARKKGNDTSRGGYTSRTFTWPIPGYSRISSPFGMRTHPVTGTYKLHTGTDFPAPSGTRVVSAGDGTVVKSAMTRAYGNYIIVSHGGGVMTAYAHLSKRSVSVGDKVSAGQKIGAVGTTGWSTGNHLHFEVIVNGSFTNPMSYFN